MFWDKKNKCHICCKIVLEKNMEKHWATDFGCNAEKWRRKCIAADIENNKGSK